MIDHLAVGRVLKDEPPSPERKKVVMDFFKRVHHRFSQNGVSYGAVVLLPNDDVRILGGRDQTLLEFYIKHTIPEHVAAEIVKLENIQ